MRTTVFEILTSVRQSVCTICLKVMSFVVLLSMTLTSCSSEDTEEATDNNFKVSHEYKMTMGGSKLGFDATRSSGWADGDSIYIQFYYDDQRVTGIGKYRATDDSWTLYCNGELPESGEYGCKLYSFDGATTAGSTVQLGLSAAIYEDDDASWHRGWDGEVIVNGMLLPKTGRLYFTGAADTPFKVSGLQTTTSYDLTADAFSTEATDEQEMTVGTEGRTPYIYVSFTTEERSLTITTDDGIFNKAFGAEVLAAGSSGYITIPTREGYDGWSWTKTEMATLATTEVNNITLTGADFSSAVLDNGGAEITECGFIVSTDSRIPEVLDDTIRVDTELLTDSTFTRTVSDLKENTTYYVCSFATNRYGTAYGEVRQFMTLNPDYADEVSVTATTSTSVTLQMTLTQGTEYFSEYGVCYAKGTDVTPTVDGSHVSSESATMTPEITDLESDATYTLRTYVVTNQGEVVYLSVLTATTMKAAPSEEDNPLPGVE